jgi:acyl-CoA reductase-like NAD-dependent aldehyde dehydrogenase/nicotinamidase-related amidase
MKSALLLIDLQSDFLERKDLFPRSDLLIGRVERLLSGCRSHRVPVFHVWTQVRRDGTDRMPHWQRNNTWICVEGSSGVLPPEVLRPNPDELLFTKQYFSAFGNSSLIPTLQEYEIDSVIIAGIFLHGCIRSTAIDAYERGYEVWIADDAVGSDEPVHAEITRTYLDGRAAKFMDTHRILSQLGPEKRPRPSTSDQNVCPVANIGGKWVKANGRTRFDRYNPSNWTELIASVPLATNMEVNEASTQASKAQRVWRDLSSAHRAAILNAWADTLSKREKELAQLLAKEIGKPLTSGYDEVRMATSLIRATAGLLINDQMHTIDHEERVHVRYRPHGVVGLITPWNNPIAIPVGKISPALAYGNTAVWKPAVEAPQTAMAVIDSLYQAGGTAGIVNLVFGEGKTAREIIENPVVTAVSFTGSTEVGNSIAALCARFGKPFQAELGGNNAAIVCRDCDFHAEAHRMAISAFSFAGQRCTSIQRFIVERPILNEFKAVFVKAVEALKIGDPSDHETIVGPLVSQSHHKWICSLLDRATKGGAEIFSGGTTPKEFQNGCWLSPTIVGQVDLNSPLSQVEIFGPVAVIHSVDNFKEAIEVNNSVKFGLVAALYSNDKSNRRRFAEAIETGILNFTQRPLVVHPAAPFGGWKASGLGPPEHGLWDQQFYTKTQTIYAWRGMTV